MAAAAHTGASRGYVAATRSMRGAPVPPILLRAALRRTARARETARAMTAIVARRSKRSRTCCLACASSSAAAFSARVAATYSVQGLG